MAKYCITKMGSGTASDKVVAELLEIDLLVPVSVAVPQQTLNKFFVVRKVSLVSLEHCLQLLPRDLAIAVEVEEAEGVLKVLFVVGGGLREAGRDELIVGDATVVVYIETGNNLVDLLELWLMSVNL